MEGEEWLPVVGFEETYEVSNKGRVRSIDRVTPYRGTTRFYRGKLLSPATNGTSNHLFVLLYVPGSGNRKRVNRKVHRLMLEAFVGPCPDGQEACHWDDVADHNVLENLRWDTRPNNIADRKRNRRAA